MGVTIAIILVLTVSFLESISYLGFVANHTKIPALVIYFLCLLFITKKSKSLPSVTFKKLLFLNMITASFLFIGANLIEALTYKNYIFAHFHLNLKGLNFYTFFSLLFYFLPNQWLLASLIFFSLTNLAGIIPEIIKSLKPIIANPLATHDQKMTQSFPDFYPAIKIIKNLTLSNATIIIPPQKIPWVSEGNDAYINSFLYPRTIIHWPENNQLPPGEVYILIVKGAWPADDSTLHGWPKIPISAKKIWKIDPKTNSYQVFNKDYDPTTDFWDYGLIEANHE